jgi:DNA-directed RNA polymerase specialized sigma24 family protein
VIDDRPDERRAAGFRRLLERLDRDPERAGAEFERIRRTLTRFFDWRGAPFPDECADETLDRLIAKLGDGTAVLDVGALAHGIARLVLLEDYRARGRQEDLGADLPDRPQEPEEPRSLLLDDLDACLEGLGGEERTLVLAYYAEPAGRRKIEARRHLAGALRLSDNALRSRVQRLRDRLETCLARRGGAVRAAARFGPGTHGSMER